MTSRIVSSQNKVLHMQPSLFILLGNTVSMVGSTINQCVYCQGAALL